jgi:hypothetical protein
MIKTKIIQDAISILKDEVSEGKQLYVEIVAIGFLDKFSKQSISCEFACVKAEEFDEGFHYNVSDKKYYYYGEALQQNPGSFSNRVGFVIEGDDLKILPDKLKTALSQVAVSKLSQKLQRSHIS